MKVERVEADVRGSPARARLSAHVSYADGTADTYWFEVERELQAALSRSGNPWLACLLPLAVTLGEPLEIPLPVDALLYENACHLMHIWQAWYPQLHVVPLDLDVTPAPADGGERKSAAFFSGGVDSFFSVLRHGEGLPATSLQLDDLLFIWGADIPIRNVAAFTRAHCSLTQAAAELGKRLVPVATNLRETRWQQTSWAYLSHGAMLGAIALALENRYGSVLVASSTPYRRLEPWGSHPLTDPLFSTTRLRLIHDGAFFDRLEKLTQLVNSDIVMRYLRVCWRSETGDNCGRCEKCYRTMAMLAALDALGRCETFRPREFQLEGVTRIFSKRQWMHGLRDLASLAEANGKTDLTRALRRSMANSRRLQRVLPILHRFQGRPVVRRMAVDLENRLTSRLLS